MGMHVGDAVVNQHADGSVPRFAERLIELSITGRQVATDIGAWDQKRILLARIVSRPGTTSVEQGILRRNPPSRRGVTCCGKRLHDAPVMVLARIGEGRRLADPMFFTRPVERDNLLTNFFLRDVEHVRMRCRMTPDLESLCVQLLDLLPGEPACTADPSRGDVECRAEAVFLEDRCGSSQIADIPVVERQDHEFVGDRQEILLLLLLGLRLRRGCL